MPKRYAPSLLVVAVIGAGAFAVLRAQSAPTKVQAAAQPLTEPGSPVAANPHAGLPPNHPPIGGAPGGAPPHGAMPPASNEAPAIDWKVPPAWQTVPNPSAMRLATYKVAAAASDGEGAEMSVMRAGGSTDANIQRWIGQFDDAGKDQRTDKTVHGLEVAIVEVGGNYLGAGMNPKAASGPRPGWALLGAIVETQGSPYFFKLVGPAKTVASAHAAFDTLIDSITPR